MQCDYSSWTGIAFEYSYATMFSTSIDRRSVWCYVLVLSAVLALACSCSAESKSRLIADESQRPYFESATDELELTFTHSSGVDGSYFLPEIMGSGAAIFDYDDDGLLDIYLVNSGTLAGESEAGMNRLFQQQSNGKFVDRTDDSGTGDLGYGMGATVGDINNDGLLDLYVTNFSNDHLYLNLGSGQFRDITEESGIKVPDWSTSATFCDVNLDGLLDLYVATYVSQDVFRVCKTATGEIDYCAPNVFSAKPDYLFINRGDAKFTSVPIDQVGIRRPNRGLGVICVDFNQDSYPDFYVANDGERNFLWVNNGDATFHNHALRTGVAVNIFGESEASMGIDVADLNDDQRLDIFVTHLDQETDTLYISDGTFFTDRTSEWGLSQVTLADSGFGTAFADFDHNGYVDMMVVNGNVRKPMRTLGGESLVEGNPIDSYREFYAARNRLFLNTAERKFAPIDDDLYGLEESGGVSRGLIVHDMDNDGDLDVLVTDSNDSAKLYRNEYPALGNWLQLKIVDPKVKRDAIGSLVFVYAGNRVLVRPVLHSKGYLTSQDATVHFGLGEMDSIDEIVVQWLNGDREKFGPRQLNKLHTLLKNTGSPLNAGPH